MALGLATLSAGFAAAGGMPAHAAAATLTATPSTNLVNGQFVKLDFAGLPASSGLAFRECVTAPVMVATDCTPTSPTGGVSDANGAGDNYLQIRAGQLVASGSTAATPLAITCDAGAPCVIAAVQDNNDLNGAVFAPITFAPSPASCPAARNGILGVGSSSAFSAMYRWEGAECLPPASVSVGYTAGAIDDYPQPFFNGVGNAPPNTVAFAVTGPQPTMPAPPAGSSLAFNFAPLTTSGVVLAFLMYDNTGAQITSLRLTPDLIAQILLGEVPNWNRSAAIAALNPSIASFPSRIVSYFRAEASSQSYVLSSWLAANAPKSWFNHNGANPGPLNPSLNFPQQAAGASAHGITGADALGLAVASYAPLDELDQGAIGFMDSSTAAFYGLPTVQIQRPDGTVVSATTATITRAITEDAVRSDRTLAINYGNADPLAYPLAMPTYMLAPGNTLDPAQGTVLAAFLRYAVQAGQSNEPLGYAPLPANLVKESLAVAGTIPVSTAAAPARTGSARPSGLASGLRMPHRALSPRILPKSSQAAATSAAACPARGATSPPDHCPAPAGLVLAPSAGQRFTTLGDWSAAPAVVPSLAAAAVVSVIGGLLLSLMGRRRRAKAQRS